MVSIKRRSFLFLLLATSFAVPSSGFNSISFIARGNQISKLSTRSSSTRIHVSTEESSSTTDGGDASSSTTTTKTPPPILNGKMVIPMRVLMPGLADHDNIAAVYAVLTSGYVRGKGDGWPQAKFVSVTRNLRDALQVHVNDHGSDKVAHVRALSFSFPQEGAMQDVAAEWTKKAMDAGAQLQDWITPELLQKRLSALSASEEDEDDEDDEFEDMPAAVTGGDSIISPFAGSDEAAVETTPEGKPLLAFNPETVDKVLDEVRPYLISDGGNVAVEKVDPVEKTVYLTLEGACGSCASSTVTMNMGIERVLKESFGKDVQVVEVKEEEPEVTSLTVEAVEAEIKRIGPAILAMGAEVELRKVDVETGHVEIMFRGGTKVQHGLEMALLDIPYCHAVSFVSE